MGHKIAKMQQRRYWCHCTPLGATNKALSGCDHHESRRKQRACAWETPLIVPRGAARSKAAAGQPCPDTFTCFKGIHVCCLNFQHFLVFKHLPYLSPSVLPEDPKPQPQARQERQELFSNRRTQDKLSLAGRSGVHPLGLHVLRACRRPPPLFHEQII